MTDPGAAGDESEDVRAWVDQERRVGVLELCRPPNNFLDITLLTQVVEGLSAFDRDESCGAVLLCAQGKHFCAGRDFSRPRAPGDESAAVYGMAAGLLRTDKPIVAAVQGAAIGAGLGLALTADFRLASPRAYLSANFVSLGLHPGFGLTLTLPALIGSQRAAQMMYSGARIGAETALGWGLVDAVHEEADLLEAALTHAGELSALPSEALAATRRTLRGPDLVERFERATAHESAEQSRLRGASTAPNV